MNKYFFFLFRLDKARILNIPGNILIIIGDIKEMQKLIKVSFIK